MKQIDDVISANPVLMEEAKLGKAKALNALVGMVLKATRGRENPAQVTEAIRQRITGRKLVDEAATSFYVEDHTLGEIYETVKELIEDYGKDARVMYYYPDRYSDSKYLYVFRKRPETDEEMAKRLAYEAKMAADREEYERREFERLSAKFKG